MNDLDETRARLLATLQRRARIVFPIRRRKTDPDDFQNMIHPLRMRRDYTSVGRPTFLVTELPEE